MKRIYEWLCDQGILLALGIALYIGALSWSRSYIHTIQESLRVPVEDRSWLKGVIQYHNLRDEVPD